MDTDLFHRLKDQELISDSEYEAVVRKESARAIALFTDLHALLYSGILMFAGGIGILIYKHIDSIGHLTLVILTGLLCAGCFTYCVRKAPLYSRYKTEPPNQWFDYILLLGCLLMVTFFGYVQYQFHAFGSRWGLATFIPTVLLYLCAYNFDHKGVLSLAIAGMGAWMGVAVEPMGLIRGGRLGNENYVINGIMLGVILTLKGIATVRLDIKAHFAFVFRNFGMHVLMISLVSAMFIFCHSYGAWFVILAAAGVWYFITAIAERSFYFLLFSVLYLYAGLSTLIVRALVSAGGDISIAYMIILYFIFSAVGLTAILRHYNRKFNEADDSL